MKNRINWIGKNLHLMVSLSIVVPTAIIYGSPLLSAHLDIKVETVDLSNFLKAIMCLYLAIAGVWVLGVWKYKHWKIATQLNVLFMLSLGIGRLLSMGLDGIPTSGYIFGVLAELGLGLFAIYQLNKYGKEVRLTQ